MPNPTPNPSFTAEQKLRLGQLMKSWQVARESSTALIPSEQTELNALVEAELLAAGEHLPPVGSRLAVALSEPS